MFKLLQILPGIIKAWLKNLFEKLLGNFFYLSPRSMDASTHFMTGYPCYWCRLCFSHTGPLVVPVWVVHVGKTTLPPQHISSDFCLVESPEASNAGFLIAMDLQCQYFNFLGILFQRGRKTRQSKQTKMQVNTGSGKFYLRKAPASDCLILRTHSVCGKIHNLAKSKYSYSPRLHAKSNHSF